MMIDINELIAKYRGEISWHTSEYEDALEKVKLHEETIKKLRSAVEVLRLESGVSSKTANTVNINLSSTSATPDAVPVDEEPDSEGQSLAHHYNQKIMQTISNDPFTTSNGMVKQDYSFEPEPFHIKQIKGMKMGKALMHIFKCYRIITHKKLKKIIFEAEIDHNSKNLTVSMNQSLLNLLKAKKIYREKRGHYEIYDAKARA